MRFHFAFLAYLLPVLGCASTTLRAQSPTPPTPAADDDQSLVAVSNLLRGYLITAVPNPIWQKLDNWGKTDIVPNQIKWRRKGILLVPKVYKARRNHGTWERARFTHIDLRKSLAVAIRDYKKVNVEKRTFTVFVAFDARFEYNLQIWKFGSRLLSASVRAKMRAKARLDCELLIRLEKNGKKWIPDAVLTLRVVQAQSGYDNLVFEHVPGINGRAARFLGKTAHNTLNRFKPSLERSLFEQINAAIIRAAGTREIRISLSKLFV